MAVHATPQSARALGRYEVIAEIARGGMGTVLLARLAGAGGFQRFFALKLLHRQYLDDTEFVQMLLDEARIAARINHPNVVSIQEVEETPEHGYFLVMDYVEGFTLADLSSAAAPLLWKKRARIMIRVVLDALHGLDAAHNLIDDYGRPLNVVHRDVSPQNILVGTNGIARVTDFGIAKAAARMTSTRVGQVKGKLAYMSPEQARGRATDARTDVWAIGVVLWETLAARRLFRVENESETYQRVLMAPIPRLIDVVRDAPVAIADVISHALDRDAARRFGSAREMAQALETLARAHDLLADPHEIGHWIRTTFATQLKLRQDSIRMASEAPNATGQRLAALPGGLRVPQLPEESVSLTLDPPPGPPDEGTFTDLSTNDFSAPDTIVRPPTQEVSTTDSGVDELSTSRQADHLMSLSVQNALASLREVQSQGIGPRLPPRVSAAPPAPSPPNEELERFGETAAVPLVSSVRAPMSSLRAPTRPTELDPARAMPAAIPAVVRPPAKSGNGLAVALAVVALAAGSAAGWMIWHRTHAPAPFATAPR